jgi:hypothetical protein
MQFMLQRDLDLHTIAGADADVLSRNYDKTPICDKYRKH